MLVIHFDNLKQESESRVAQNAPTSLLEGLFYDRAEVSDIEEGNVHWFGGGES